jgi:chemotaxis protein MotA
VFTIIGLVIVIGSVIGGYVMHHGKIAVLWQPTEFIIIGGAGLGAFIVANGIGVLKASLAATIGLLKPNPFSKEAYGELLQVLYEIFQKARKDGLVGLESHIEEPDKSDIFTKFPRFAANAAAVALLADTLKVLLTGAVEDHNLAEILDIDLDQQHEANMHVPHAITTVGDAMPGFGIVAAVLGVIITMGSIGGAAERDRREGGRRRSSARSSASCSPTASSARSHRPSRAREGGARVHVLHPHGAPLVRARRRADDGGRVRSS